MSLMINSIMNIVQLFIESNVWLDMIQHLRRNLTQEIVKISMKTYKFILIQQTFLNENDFPFWKREFKTMSNLSIFMMITNSFLSNLPITYACGDYERNSYISALASGGYIELDDANRHRIDLLYHLRYSLLFESYLIFIFIANSYFFLIGRTSLNQGVTSSPD